MKEVPFGVTEGDFLSKGIASGSHGGESPVDGKDVLLRPFLKKKWCYWRKLEEKEGDSGREEGILIP